MISSFSLYLVLMVAFWIYAWLGQRLVGRSNGEMGEPSKGHFQAVDGLRGVLALSVFVHHAWCMRNLCLRSLWSDEGDAIFSQAAVYAVTLFFFITGFVFWTKLQREPRLRFGKHLRSRIARLVPAYWAVIGLILLSLVFDSEWIGWTSSVTTLKTINSWMLFTLPGTEGSDDWPLIGRLFLSVVWTLKLEWIFYLIIPFCGWFATRFWRTGLFVGLLLVIHTTVMMNTTNAAIPREIRTLARVTTSNLMFCFSGGILVAEIRRLLCEHYSKINFRGVGFSIFGTGMLVWLFFLMPARYSLEESLWLLIPFLLVTLGNDWFGLLTSKPMLFLGKISYSVYLLHIILLFFTFHWINTIYPVGKISPMAYWLIIAGHGAVLIALSALWHQLFEAPFMKASR